MKETFFFCYPWDLDHEGVEAAVGRMAGDIGVNALSVAATLHSLRERRARAAPGPRTIEMEAAAHFQPDAPRYANTRIRPLVGAWLKARNPLEKILREAELVGLHRRVSMVATHSAPLAARYPLIACVDVFGDPICSCMCPANAEVREFVAALVDDLSTNYPVETIELADFWFGGRHPHPHLRGGISLAEVESGLFDWCFCASCRQRATDAGLDVEQVADRVRDHLEAAFRLEPPRCGSLDELLAEEPTLAEFHRLRLEAVASLLSQVRSRAKARVLADLSGLSADEAAWRAVSLTALAAGCDGLLLAPPAAEHHEGRAFFEEAVQAVHGPPRVDLSITCYPPRTRTAPALVSEVRRLAEVGYSGFGFHNYGLAPEPCLDWVRLAVRYARRESGQAP